MRLQSSREGCLLIDHQSSPGLPDGFMRSIGLSGLSASEGKTLEAATLTCSHCNAIVVKNPGRTRERGFCPKCNEYICDPCVAKRDCTPFLKILDEAEQRAYREQQSQLTTRFTLLQG